MRTLFTVQPAIGHLNPLIAPARALRDAGHEVAFASSPSFRPQIEAFGFECLGAGIDWVASDMSTWTAFPPMPPPPDPAFPQFVVKVFADVTAEAMAPDVVAICEEWQPDVVVREMMEWGGCLAAEKLGIAHASAGGNAYSGVDSPDINYFPGNRRMVAEPLARHRARLGLPPDPDLETPFRHLHMCFMPREWDRPEAPAPPNTHHLRHTTIERPGQALPAWLDELPDQPTVLVAIGTIAHVFPGLFEAAIEGLRDAGVNLILAVGPHVEQFGPQPSHVRIEPWVPQPSVLPRCDAFVTHGGFNSVKEALSLGIPLVVVPIMSDEPYSAERCAALGVGRVLQPAERSPQAIRDAVLDVLGDSAYRARAQEFAARMEALPGPERVVELIASLAQAPAGAAT
jgi:MGT family glycosyltransferase